MKEFSFKVDIMLCFGLGVGAYWNPDTNQFLITVPFLVIVISPE